MATEVRTLTSMDDYDTLVHIADGRKGTVKVDREMLDRLLTDFMVLLNAVRGSASFKLTEPTLPQQTRRRAHLK